MKKLPELLVLLALAGCGEDAAPAGALAQAASTTGAGAGGEMAAGTASGGGAASTTGATGSSAASGACGASPEGWSPVTSLAAPQQECGVAAIDADVYVVGGFNHLGSVLDAVEVLDTATGTWRSAAPLPAPRHHVNVGVVDGKLYALGALVGLGFAAVGETYVYDPEQDGWSARAAMPAGTERGGSAVGVIGTKIYVAGGWRSGAVGDFSAYDTATDTWQELPDLPEVRDHLVGGAVGGVMFAVGGRDGSINGVRARVDAFDPDGGSWVSKAPMPTARGGAAAAVAGGLLYVFGGEGNPSAATGVFAETEAYDPAADTWASLAPMTTPRHGTGAASVGATVYVPGGADKAGFGAVDTVERYAPE